jgi:hypothetical protein
MDIRSVQFNLTREITPLQLQWPILSSASSPSTPVEIEMHSVWMTPPDIMELSSCEREDRLRILPTR